MDPEEGEEERGMRGDSYLLDAKEEKRGMVSFELE